MRILQVDKLEKNLQITYQSFFTNNALFMRRFFQQVDHR